MFQRYENPVLTSKHIPPFWKYDLNPETNPYFMERLGVNAVFNSGTGRLEIGDNELSKPGDKCYWKITVKNTGLFDALLNGYYFNPGSNTCTKYNNNIAKGFEVTTGNLTYQLCDEDVDLLCAIHTNSNNYNVKFF